MIIKTFKNKDDFMLEGEGIVRQILNELNRTGRPVTVTIESEGE